jgi:16S rRNA processing protein RimM
MSDPPDRKYVTVARILRARGNKGEVAAELLTDFPERLPHLREMYLRGQADTERAVLLRAFWMDRNHAGQGVFHFEGCNSIDAAEKLRGLDVQIPLERRAVPPAGVYFVTDLIGCAVFEMPGLGSAVASSPCLLSEVPTALGKVRDVYFPGEGQPGTPLLALDTADGELLVPLAADICRRIDVAARRIDVELPEGLRGLNG